MRLIIARHAKTICNEKRIVQGHQHGELSTGGIQQAKKLAKRLLRYKIDKIYCSDLGRAKQTLDFFLEKKKIPVKYTQSLREQALGSWEGKNFDDLKAQRVKHGVRYTPKDAETLEHVRDRARRFYNKILKKYPKKTALIISHNMLIKTLIGSIKAQGLTESFNLRYKNTAITIIDIDVKKDKKRFRILNNTAHLEKKGR